VAVGKSNRIVVEVEPDFKAQIYAALKARGLTFKEWLTEQASTDLIGSKKEARHNKSKGRAR
jgi:hypothetical protein